MIKDVHGEKISNILDCLYVLLAPVKTTKGVVDNPRHHINTSLAYVDNSLARISDELKDMKSSPDMDRCLLEQLAEQLSGLKLELVGVS